MSTAATTELAALPRCPSLQTFFNNLDSFAELPEGVAKLRELILDLAVRGKLVEQDENDEPASELIDAIQESKRRLVDAKEIKKPRPLPTTTNGAASTEIPTGWTLTRLGDLAFDFQNGVSKRRSAVGEPVPVLRLADIKSGEISSKEFREIPLTDDELAQYPLVKGDVLVIRVNGSVDLVGRFIPCRESRRWTYCDHFIRMRVPTEYVDQRFLCILANSRWGREHVGNNTVTTAGQKTINQTGVGTMPILLPPLSEQRRIVSKVDSLMSLCDELDSNNAKRVKLRERGSRSCLERLVSSRSPKSKGTDDLASAWQRLSDHFEVLYDTPKTLAHLRQSILQLAVQGKLVPQDPNEESVEKSVADARKSAGLLPLELNGSAVDEGEFELPISWRWVRVHDVAEHRLGKMLDKAKNTGRPQPYLRNTNVHWFNFDLSSVKEMLFEDDELNGFEVRRGDLMICEGGHGIARTAVWEEELDRIMFQKALHRVRPLSCLDSYFLAFCLRVYEATGVLQRYYTGAGIPHFTGKSLGKVLFPLPPLAEQKRIVAKVDQLLSQCEELSARLRERQSASHGLLTATIHELVNPIT